MFQGFETKGSYTTLKDKNRNAKGSSTPQQSKELQLFYETIMATSGKQLKSAGLPAPSSNFCQMLQDISEVRRFEISCFDISERSTTGGWTFTSSSLSLSLSLSIPLLI